MGKTSFQKTNRGLKQLNKIKASIMSRRGSSSSIRAVVFLRFKTISSRGLEIDPLLKKRRSQMVVGVTVVSAQ